LVGTGSVVACDHGTVVITATVREAEALCRIFVHGTGLFIVAGFLVRRWLFWS
jgi:hypothetical protein